MITEKNRVKFCVEIPDYFAIPEKYKHVCKYSQTYHIITNNM